MLPITRRAALLTLLLLAGPWGCGSDGDGDGGWKPGEPLALDVSDTFPAGTAVRDHYTGATATVAADGKVTITPGTNGVVLLEQDGAAAPAFRWDAATIYFAMTDRFFNGDPENDQSYGRTPDGAQEVGTWHGGDLAGLTAKLDHLEALGATAVWISPPVEQVHGWAAGGNGRFKHYGYHGYWALDFTKLDANFGSEDDLRAFVDAAHARGIRVVFDVVMNHPGYATGADLAEYLPEVIDEVGFTEWDATAASGLDAWHGFVDYAAPGWESWWGPSWIRAELGPEGTYTPPGTGDLQQQLSYLPDFITEATEPVTLPELLRRKTDTAAAPIEGATVRDHLVEWHTSWVRRFGIDGFRCDTAKHVELEAWEQLKGAGTEALAAWKAANPAEVLEGDAPFWMVGEVYPHGVTKDAYFTEGGFDSVLNFDFQSRVSTFLDEGAVLAEAAEEVDALYLDMATKLSTDATFDVTSYLSSHDTRLFFESVAASPEAQRQAGTALLLAPGSVQIFYGDESGRRAGPTAGQATQGTRSDMNWDAMDAGILAHWQKVGTFRRRHPAIGAGTHRKIASPDGTYAFSRALGDEDAVVVVITPPAS